jgi:hypothetical protein
MESIDVRDLPEPMAEAIRMMVEALRDQLASPRKNGDRPNPSPVELPVWHLGIIGNLTRKEIYDERC